MISSQDVKVLDINAEFFGTSTDRLMEEAGRQVAQFINEQYKNQTILVLCGLGNNAGDGFVAARYLSKKHTINVFLFGDEKDIKTSNAYNNYKKLGSHPVTLYDIKSLDKIDTLIEKATIILDAMLGVGITGALREPYISIIDKINARNDKNIVSIDVPTGMGLADSLKAHHTITFHDKKTGMDPDRCGTIHIKKIGIPKQAETHVGPGELTVLYPRPKKSSHKGENGRILIVGGGPYHGAPYLTGLASLRTGADLVHVATPEKTASIISHYSPNLIIHSQLSKNHLQMRDVQGISNITDSIDAIVIGPGLGSEQDTYQATRALIEDISKKSIPMVIDADGLNALRNHHDIIKNSTTVITPHKTEFKRFIDQTVDQDIKKQKEQVEKWAKKLGITIFLKGPTDIISNGDLTRFNIVHNEAMTVGGTGDVLAGIIGTLLSKKVTPINACRIAAFLSGEAGNVAFEKKSFGLIATDVIDEIPGILKKYL
jgi:ADP-dependent NAD(P)H-hydrate dehydratase / NAD(P)H-hydrate epimerase